MCHVATNTWALCACEGVPEGLPSTLLQNSCSTFLMAVEAPLERQMSCQFAGCPSRFSMYSATCRRTISMPCDSEYEPADLPLHPYTHTTCPLPCVRQQSHTIKYKLVVYVPAGIQYVLSALLHVLGEVAGLYEVRVGDAREHLQRDTTM